MHLCFGNGDPVLHGYKDADYAGDKDSRKSTSGYLMTFVGEQCHGNQGYRSVFHYQQQKLARKCYG